MGMLNYFNSEFNIFKIEIILCMLIYLYSEFNIFTIEILNLMLRSFSY